MSVLTAARKSVSKQISSATKKTVVKRVATVAAGTALAGGGVYLGSQVAQPQYITNYENNGTVNNPTTGGSGSTVDTGDESLIPDLFNFPELFNEDGTVNTEGALKYGLIIGGVALGGYALYRGFNNGKRKK